MSDRSNLDFGACEDCLVMREFELIEASKKGCRRLMLFNLMRRLRYDYCMQ